MHTSARVLLAVTIMLCLFLILRVTSERIVACVRKGVISHTIKAMTST